MLRILASVLLCTTVACATSGTSRSYDQRAQLMVGAKPTPMDDALLEGVWNDWSDSAIAIVHKEGDEYRLLVAVGDTRPNIPLTTFEATNMGNPLPTPEARTRATEALKTWRAGDPTGDNRFLFAMAGKSDGAQGISGSWTEGNSECTVPRWGNFYFRMNKDAAGSPVLYFSIYATAKHPGPGLGGQTYEFGRYIYFGKAAQPIPPSILEEMQKTESFCRRTAE